MRSRYTPMVLSATISMESKNPCNPERSTLAASSAGSPLVKRTSEAAYAISMLLNIVPLGLIQDMPCVGAGVTEGLDQREKAFQGVLEKDVALPKSIVRIDEQS